VVLWEARGDANSHAKHAMDNPLLSYGHMEIDNPFASLLSSA
jgi:hypothetical protein